MHELILRLSKSEFIKIVPEYNESLKEVDYCCGQITAYFIDERNKLKIGQQTAGEFFEGLIGRLKKVIENKLQLHESIHQNLGLMYNEYYQDKSDFTMVSTIHSSQPSWVGFNYNVWSTYGDADPLVSIWLYNDSHQNIIFEATKDYPWHFMKLEDDPDPEFITYDEFMKDYKPLLTRVIPRDVAIEWLEQAMKIYKGLFEDEKDFIRACNEMNE